MPASSIPCSFIVAQGSASVPSPSNPHKKRRLQFTSELPVTIPQYNDDGTETDEWARYQSNLRLKSKWDSICDKFSNAHLLPQDEIYLGDERRGEQMKVIKDRGILRQVTEPIEFGMFHIRDEDLKHVKLVRRKARPAKGGRAVESGEESSDDELAEWTHTVRFSRMVRAPASTTAATKEPPMPSSAGEDRQSQPKTQVEMPPQSQDAQLAEFLEAEARRRAMCEGEGIESEDDEDDEDIFDFGDPEWETGYASFDEHRRRYQQKPEEDDDDDDGVAQSSDRGSSPISSADDGFDAISLSSGDDGDGYADWVATKRQAVEDLLQAPQVFETLPFADIDGLSDCLGRLLAKTPAMLPPSSFETDLGDGSVPSQEASDVALPSPAPPPSYTSDLSQSTPSRRKKNTPQKQTPRKQTPRKPTSPVGGAPAAPVSSPIVAKMRTPRPSLVTPTPSKRTAKRRPAASGTRVRGSSDDGGGDGGFFGTGSDCLGPGLCAKSFCMECGSVSAVSRHRKSKTRREEDPQTPSRRAAGATVPLDEAGEGQ